MKKKTVPKLKVPKKSVKSHPKKFAPPAKPKLSSPKKPAKAAPSSKPKKAVPAKSPALPQKYSDALERIRVILSKPAGGEAKMLEICWLLNSKFPHYNWVGVYIATGNRELALGPFVGEATEHVRIPFGRGICGQAAETKKTFVVDDVSKEANYLACSMYVRSEIVVPIIVRGEIAGELDIDSHAPNAFTKDDRAFLEKMCVLLSDVF